MKHRFIFFAKRQELHLWQPPAGSSPVLANTGIIFFAKRQGIWIYKTPCESVFASSNLRLLFFARRQEVQLWQAPGNFQSLNAVVWYEDRLFFLVIVRIFKPVALCWFWNCGVYWLLGLVLLCFLHACNIYKSLLPSPVSSALNPKLPPLCLSRETGKDN